MSSSVVAITHAEGSDPATFVLTRLPDGKALAPVSVGSPYEFPVEGQPNSNLMLRLRWYLEEFLQYPFEPELTNAGRVLDGLKAWGTAAFNALFDRRRFGAEKPRAEGCRDESRHGRPRACATVQRHELLLISERTFAFDEVAFHRASRSKSMFRP